jgi:hypothetical protein
MQLDIGSLVNDLIAEEQKLPGTIAALRAGVVKAEGSTTINFLLGRIVADPKAAEAEVLSAIDAVTGFLPTLAGFIDPALKILLNLRPAPVVPVVPAPGA